MLVFIEFLRAIATLLIFNSHLKGVYPTDILSFGGGLGLAVFYMLTGYLLSNINENTRFPKWYAKKLLRLYVPLVLFKTILVVIGEIQIKSFVDFIKNFIFPTYWFVASMVIFYAVYFVFVKYIYKNFGRKSIIVTWIFCGLSFIVLYITKNSIGLFSIGDLNFAKTFEVETPYLISQFIWFSSMLGGLYIKESFSGLKRSLNKKYKHIVSVVVCILLFLLIRVLQRYGVDIEFLLPVSYFGFAYSMFIWFMGLENKLKTYSGKIYYKPIEIISKCSLELYYVQFVIIELLHVLIFPINLIVILITTVIIGFILNQASMYTLKILRI